MESYDRVYTMDRVFSIWRYSKRLRVTYVSQGWLVVWDHQESPPTRYDCKNEDHDLACKAVVDKIRELTAR